MATFNPPDSHWAADFDERLAGTFAWLKERVESLQERVVLLEREARQNENRLVQAVADAKFWAQQAKENG